MQHSQTRNRTWISPLAGVVACALALVAALFCGSPAYADDADSANGGALAAGDLTAQSALEGKLYGATWKLSAMPGQNPCSLLTISPEPDVIYMGMVAPECGSVDGSDGYGWATNVNAGNSTSER